MAQTDSDRLQINVDFSSFPDLLKQLDQMVAEDDTDRSKFIRKLIREEISRRQQLPLFPPDKTEKKTNPRMRAARAEAVAA